MLSGDTGNRLRPPISPFALLLIVYPYNRLRRLSS